MSKRNLEKRIDDLDAQAKAKHAADIAAILARYGDDPVKLVEYGSAYEKQRFWTWTLRRAYVLYEALEPIFIPVFVELFLETEIYPLVLRGFIDDEDRWTVWRLDLLYIRWKHPDLLPAFLEEENACPSYDEDPEGWGNWRMSPELSAQLRQAHADLDQKKAAIRERLKIEDAKWAELDEEDDERSSDG